MPLPGGLHASVSKLHLLLLLLNAVDAVDAGYAVYAETRDTLSFRPIVIICEVIIIVNCIFITKLRSINPGFTTIIHHKKAPVDCIINLLYRYQYHCFTGTGVD